LENRLLSVAAVVVTGVSKSGILADGHRHFVPGRLLDSRFAALEPSGAAENLISIRIDETVGAIVDEIVTALSLPAARMTEPV
jgi:gluconate kinase